MTEAPQADPAIGQLVIATRVITGGPASARSRSVLVLLAVSVGLMMIGYGIAMPVFAKRLAELGSGVAALGFMTMGFAAAQFFLSPVMGSLADRIGRRPLVLVALAGMVVSNIGYLLIASTTGYIALRVFQGAITAGLLPAAIAIVGDSVPERRRAQGTGMMMGAYGAGFIFGPVIGGALFDRWGFPAPFVMSAALALAAFIFATVLLPETRPRTAARVARETGSAGGIGRRVSAALTAPVHILAALLVLDFTAVFTFAFIEPQMYFYLYGRLGFTAIEVGSLIGAFGLAMVAAQAGLGQLSDRIGRRVPIVTGFVLLGVFYLALAAAHARVFALLLFVAAAGGLGNGLFGPALSASYLDITREQNRSVVVGIKGSASSAGGVAGPFLVAVLSPALGARGVFAGSAALAALAALLALLALRFARRATVAQDELISERAPVVAAGLRGIAAAAAAARNDARRTVT